MKRVFSILVAGWLTLPSVAFGDSIWDRRDPRTSHLLADTRARHVGDLLTIVIREITVFDGTDKRSSKKATSAGGLFKFRGNYPNVNQAGGNFGVSADTQLSSQRELNGQSDYKSDRTLTDRVTVRVVAVMPNGNLVVEGYRRRVVQNEERVMVISGIVRPIDISDGNVVQSQFVGNLTISYKGRGTDSSYTENGWFGRMMNHLWPF